MAAERIGIVARYTFAESAGVRLFSVMGAFAIVLFGVSRIVGPLSAGEDVKIVKDLGLAAAELTSAVMAVVLATGTLLGDVDRRVMMTWLSKPLHRWEFLVGKFLGVACALALNVALMGSLLLFVLATMNGVQTVDPRLGAALAMIAAEVILLAAAAFFLAVFSSSTLAATLLTAGIFVAGQLSGDLRAFSGTGVSPWVQTAIAAVGWMLPAFSSFDVKAQVVHGVPVPSADVAVMVGYAALYSAGLLAAAAALFARRELQ